MEDGQFSQIKGTAGEGDISKPPGGSLVTTSPPGGEIESTKASNHKRTISGSFLSRFAFLRSSSDLKSTGTANSSNAPSEADETWRPENSSASPSITSVSMRQNPAIAANRRIRSRRGSLRKTALLGGGKLRSNDKRPQIDLNTSLEVESTIPRLSSEIDSSPIPSSPPDSEDFPTPRPSYEKRQNSTVEGGGYDSAEGALQHDADGQGTSNTSDESLPLPTPLRREPIIGDMSTTDEDESSKYPSRLLAAVPSSSSGGSSSVPKKHLAADSYYPLDISSIQRRRSSHRPRAKSPLAAVPVESVAAPVEDWDYSETEWWGWVILVLTWVVFVMGMGSCFEVWSWAWDVGETPYAPPELEDDPTLPIVGYYPALIILTGVMAWVWVVVAWVGMKYFRHAKMAGDV